MDTVRAISILAVVFGHSFGFLERIDHLPLLGKVTHHMSETVLNLGILGVELFFVLSGFLIGNILIRTFTGSPEFLFSDVKNFWLRRWFRTLPNYWLILTVNIILYHFLKIATFELRHLKGYIFLQNFRHPNFLNSFPEGWSLSVEEWFYLTLPVVMFLFARIFKPKDRGDFLLNVFVGYLSVFLLARFFNAFDPLNGRDPDEGIRKIVVFRLDAVMYGVLFAYFTFYRKSIGDTMKKYLLAIGVAGSVLMVCLVLKYDLVMRSHADTSIRFFGNAFLYLFIPLFFSMCLPFAGSVKAFRNKRISGIVQHISKISYSMYLVHYSLVYYPFFMPIKPGSAGVIILWYLLYWGVVLGLATVLYKFYEYPVMKIRDRIAKNVHEANG